MKSKTYIYTLVILLTAWSCGQQPKGESAEVGEEKKVGNIDASAEIYEVDTNQSLVTWIGSKPTGQHNGTIQLENGTVAIKDGEIQGGEFTIDIKSLKDKDLEKGSDNYKKLTGHLMSDDFFYADSFPTASFEIVKVVPFDSTISIDNKDQYKTDYTPATMSEFMVKDPTHYVTGNLTMRGTTKSVKFPAKVDINERTVKAEAKFNIDRTDWGLMYGDEASVADKAQDKFIYNTVNVGLSLSASSKD